MRTKIINIKKYKGEYIPIHRPTQWGNPFKIGIDGNRREVINKYENYLRHNERLMADLPKLRNEVLGCWCKPLECHGDVIIKILNETEN